MSRASVASGSGFGIGGLDKSLPSSEPNLSVQDKDETPRGKSQGWDSLVPDPSQAVLKL